MNALVFLTLTFLFLSNAFSSVYQQFGYGARNIGLGNATVTQATDAFSLQYNPALMSQQPKPLATLGVFAAQEQFEDITNVVVDTPETGSDPAIQGGYPRADVITDVPDPVLLLAGFQMPLSRGERAIHFGMNIVMPVDKVMSAETQDAFVPQYSLYLSDSQRLSIATAFSYAPSEKFGFGLGANIYLNQGATSRLRLPAGQISTGVFKADIKPAFAPTAGAYFNFHPDWSVAFVWQHKVDVNSEIQANNFISTLPGAGIPLILRTSGSLYYDPEIFELGVKWQKADERRVLFSARYERWAGFSGTTLGLRFDTFTNTFSQILPPSEFSDIVSLRAGFEQKLFIGEGRVGYQYRPSPTPDLSGPTNYVDSDRHTGSFGWGKEINSLLGLTASSLRFDIAMFGQYLVHHDVIKRLPTYVGAPGYRVGGWVYGASFNVTSEI